MLRTASRPAMPNRAREDRRTVEPDLETVKRPRAVQAPAPRALGKGTISAVFISCNEAEVFEAALRSVAGWVDEIIVVDMHSTDGTREIARRYTDQIVDHERLTYADPARNYAFTLCSGEWILMLDPDERVTPALARELRRTAAEDTADVALLFCQQMMFGVVVHSEGAADGLHPRFFRNGTVSWPPEVHGAPDLTGLRVVTYNNKRGDVCFLHDTWRTVPTVLDKIMRYTPKDVEHLRADGVHFSLHRMFFHIMYEFLRRAYAGRAYEDGMPGLLTALYWTFYRLNIDASLWEAEGRPAAADAQVRRWGRRTGWIGRLLFRFLMLARRGAKAT